MRLYPEEPAPLTWDALEDPDLTNRLRGLLPAGPALVLVDGRSGGGKTTFAAKLTRVLDGAGVVHTDDIAWNLARFDWAPALVDGVLGPWRRGDPVSFRPPGWQAGGRPGSVNLPACPVLVVDGVGSARAELATSATLSVWVQSDRDVARRRGLQRDVELGRTPREAARFWDAWMSEEQPFLAADRPWTRATLLVNGTPPSGDGSVTLVAAGPIDI